MLGTEDRPGIMPLTLSELFGKIEEYSSEREYKVKLWYLEIYNENLRDLLSNTEDYLDLREDPAKGIIITNILEITVSSCKDIMHLLKRGNRNRTQESTMANEASSRSHAILQVQVEYKDKVTGLDAEIKVGKLSLIDLAGSERASATQNRGIRLIEGANINRSLLTLGNCINALCEANEKGTKPHVPYRDSKLTRLLKDSLGGNSRTVMIANVSPYSATFEDTYNTLKYANRAKNIKTHLQRNVLSVQYHISNYNNIIHNLKTEITELKSQLSKASQLQSLNNDKHYLNPQIMQNYENNKDKESNYSTNTKASQISQSNYGKIIDELKSHFEEEIAVKQKILEQEQEINNLTEILKNMGKIDFGLVGNEGNAIEMLNYENSININNTIDYEQNITDNREDDKNTYEVSSKRDKSKERENKMGSILNKLKKQCEINTNSLKEKIKKREAIMANYSRSGIRDLQYDYLLSMIKTHNVKLLLTESKFKENIGKVMNYIKDNYIVELENQIRVRDKLMEIGQVMNKLQEDKDELKNFKSIEDLKRDYANKLPMIPTKPVEKVSKNLRNSFIDKNLPPISSNVNQQKDDEINLANVNSILSEVRQMSNNISKLEMNQLHTQIKQDRIKRKTDFLNLKENQRGKLVQIRNYSNAIRLNNKISLLTNPSLHNQAVNVNNISAHNLSSHFTNNNTGGNLKEDNSNKAINAEKENEIEIPRSKYASERVNSMLEHKIKNLKVNEITNFTPIHKLNDSASEKSNRSQVPSGDNSRINEVEVLNIPKHNNYSDMSRDNNNKYTVSDDEGVRNSKRNFYNLKEMRRIAKQESESPKLSKDLNVQLARLERIASCKKVDIPINKVESDYASKKRESSLLQNDKTKLKNFKKIPFK